MIIPVVAAVLRDEHGRLLLAQRPKGKHLAGLWEFPGGKLEPDEKPGQGLKREIAEELGIQLLDSAPLLTLTHHYDDRSVRLMLREAHAWDGSPAGLEGQQLRWVSLADAEGLPMPAADRPIIKVLGLDSSLSAIADPSAFASEDLFVAAVASVLRAGARFIRVTMHSLADQQASALARRCANLIQGFEVRWLLGSSPEIASRVGADGVSLSANRRPGLQSRRLPNDLLVAAECTTRDDLVVAGRLGADLAVLESEDSEAAGTAVPDWAKRSALIADSPVPVFLATTGSGPDLAGARELGAYGICTRVVV